MEQQSNGRVDARQGADRPSVDRRAFLVGAGATVTGAMLVGRQALAADATESQWPIEGKDPRLVVHTKAPAVCETPAELLVGEQVTPTSLLFIRNNSQPSLAATIKPLTLAGWKIELAGLVDRPQTIDARSLADAEQVEREMMLQCSGNGRVLFSAAAPVKGTPWGRGGMGNVRFAGVPLAKFLERNGVRIKPEARFLTAEGADQPRSGEQDFEHSIPLDEALTKSILALALDGQPLPAIHGGPVRLVTPGYYGTMHVKWVSRLRFEARESDHASQIPNYRTPSAPIKLGEKFEFTYVNSEPNWRMKIKCVVLVPVPGARVPSGDLTVKGVAFNDGEARIDTVLVSPDAGRTWQRAELEAPESPYAWYRWRARLRLPKGDAEIWARAIDALGRSQPLDGAIHWNPQGYTWNGVEKIKVNVAG